MDPNKEYESAFDDASGEPATASEAATQEPTEQPDGDAFEEPTEDVGGADDGAADDVVAEDDTAEDDESVEGESSENDGASPPEGADDEGEPPADEQPAENQQLPANQQPAQPSAASLNEEALAAAYRRLREEEQAGQQQQQQQQEVSPLDKTWKDYLSDEDKAIVEEYEKEWSEVSRAEQIKRQAELQHVQDVVYSNVRSALAPIVEQLQQSKVEAHFNSIRSRVPEFDEIREPVQEWVKEQPEFVRPAFEQVLKQGSADQVVELLNAYKQATGKTGAAPQVPASSASKGQQQPAARPKRPAPSGAAKRAMAAAPSQKRSNPPAQTDPNDFASAFDEAAAGGI